MSFDPARMVKDFERTACDVAAVKQKLGGMLDKLKVMKVSAEKAAKEKPFVPASKKHLLQLRESAAKKLEELADAAKIAEQNAKNRKKEGGLDLGFLALKKIGKDDKRNTLYERLGGDLSLETAIGMVYSRADKDTRTRAFFEKNPMKMAMIKKRMQQFLTGFLGGRSQYDEDNLKPAHYYINVTDYHFDAVQEMFKEAFQSMGVHPDAVRDGMQRIGQARKDITAGSGAAGVGGVGTVRMAVAQRNIDQDKGVLWSRMGKVDGFALIMDKVYELVSVDVRLKMIFKGYDLEKIKKAQTSFLGEALGGPKKYEGSDLATVHRDLGLNDYILDCFLMNFEKALNSVGVNEESVDEVMVTLEGFRSGSKG